MCTLWYYKFKCKWYLVYCPHPRSRGEISSAGQLGESVSRFSWTEERTASAQLIFAEFVALSARGSRIASIKLHCGSKLRNSCVNGARKLGLHGYGIIKFSFGILTLLKLTLFNLKSKFRKKNSVFSFFLCFL